MGVLHRICKSGVQNLMVRIFMVSTPCGGLGPPPRKFRNMILGLLRVSSYNIIFPINLRYFLKENRLFQTFQYFIKKVKWNYFFITTPN